MEGREYSYRFVRTGPYRTHYVECGDGEPVVLVHGAGPGASGEFAWCRNLGALGRHGRAIGIDLLGYGLTDKPLDVEYRHQTFVEHLASFLDVLCLDRVRLVGNSMGAYVVARYACEHPDRVEKLLLVGSGTIATAMGLDMGMTPGLKRLVEYDGSLESLRALIEGLVHNPGKIGEDMLRKRYEQAKLPGVMESQKSFLAYFRNRLKSDPNQAQLFDLRHRLPHLTIPIRFVWGRHDVFARRDLADELQKLLSNSDFVWFENAGHVVQNDEPERFNEIALEFLFGVEPGPRRAAGA